MAGYVFALGNSLSIETVVEQGFYSTYMSPKWSIAAASTLGDYVTMKPGDNVYFFSKRKIYGIGEIVDIQNNAAVVENFNGATSAKGLSIGGAIETVIDGDCVVTDRLNRWVIAFKSSPAFLRDGIDMDDLLLSNPSAFRSLRVFWKRSFLKIDDEENKAFQTVFLRKYVQEKQTGQLLTMKCNYCDTLQRFRDQRLVPLRFPDIRGLLAETRDANGCLSNEMVLEDGILYQLANHDCDTELLFGKWDYLAHQVNASPFKPIDYMDRIDIFGYRWIEGYPGLIDKYLIVELKKGPASLGDLQQLMKYVEWVNDEYANGDYSFISAFIVASSFDIKSIMEHKELLTRNFIRGNRPARSAKWDDLKLATYQVREDGVLTFNIVDLRHWEL